jgi:RNA polymerase sigma-70 factor (ECF subfamily)
VLLSPTLLAHAAPALRDKLEASAATSDLEETLRGLVEAARRAWPALDLPPETFVRHLAERLPADPEGDPLAVVAATHAADLYLACACARGDELAIAEFDRTFIAQISKYLSRADALPAVADEVKQTLRASLLVGNGEILPRIAGYSGRGPLGAWLRVTATRAALRLRDTERARNPANAGDAAVFPARGDPEIDYLRTHYAEDFRGAFEATLASLSPREGSLLRLHFLDGMTIEAIGALYRVSGRTVKRWLARTRRRILDETHRRLAERLRISASDLDALIGLLRSRLDVSIVRFLKD